MTDRIFLDSNIWVYFFTKNDLIKRMTVSEYIGKGMENSRFVLSYQVVNEVCCTLKKKKYSESVLRRVADDMMAMCEVCNYSDEIIFLASELRERFLFSYWDSQIVASALISNCNILASEDMQDGLKIDNMIILNILNSKI